MGSSPVPVIGPIDRFAAALGVDVENVLFAPGRSVGSVLAREQAPFRRSGHGVRGDAADLVDRAGAGLPCTPEDPQSIAEVVEKFYRKSRPELDAMGKRGRWFYEQELSLQVTAKRFDRIFQAVCHKG